MEEVNSFSKCLEFIPIASGYVLFLSTLLLNCRDQIVGQIAIDRLEDRTALSSVDIKLNEHGTRVSGFAALDKSGDGKISDSVREYYLSYTNNRVIKCLHFIPCLHLCLQLTISTLS